MFLFLSNVKKAYMSHWPPKRNVVAHNGALLRAIFPNMKYPHIEGSQTRQCTLPQETDVEKHVQGFAECKVCAFGDDSIERCKNVIKSKLRKEVDADAITYLKNLVKAGRKANVAVNWTGGRRGGRGRGGRGRGGRGPGGRVRL